MLVLVMLDEPKATPETYGFATSGWNAVPTAGKIIERIAPMLGVEPVLHAEDLEKLAKLEKTGEEGREAVTDAPCWPDWSRMPRLAAGRGIACRSPGSPPTAAR